MYSTPQKGQSLIEVIVAIVLCALILLGVTKLIASVFANVDYSENQNTASNLAQQGMSDISDLHDTNYAIFLQDIGKTFCLGQTQDATTMSNVACTTPNAGPITPYTYIRSITLQNNSSCPTGTPSSQNTQAIVNVQWSDNTCGSGSYCHNSQLISCFSSGTVAPTL